MMICRQACPFNTLEGCKVEEYNAICPMSNSIMPITEYRMTNADLIRDMTDAELEDFLREVYGTGEKSAEAWYCGEGHRFGFEWGEDWLKQPAEETK